MQVAADVVVVVVPSITIPPASPFCALPFPTCRSLVERTRSDEPASQSIVRDECAHSLYYVQTTISSHSSCSSIGVRSYSFRSTHSSLYSDLTESALVHGLNQQDGDAPWWPR